MTLPSLPCQCTARKAPNAATLCSTAQLRSTTPTGNIPEAPELVTPCYKGQNVCSWYGVCSTVAYVRHLVWVTLHTCIVGNCSIIGQEVILVRLVCTLALLVDQQTGLNELACEIKFHHRHHHAPQCFTIRGQSPFKLKWLLNSSLKPRLSVLDFVSWKAWVRG